MGAEAGMGWCVENFRDYNPAWSRASDGSGLIAKPATASVFAAWAGNFELARKRKKPAISPAWRGTLMRLTRTRRALTWRGWRMPGKRAGKAKPACQARRKNATVATQSSSNKASGGWPCCWGTEEGYSLISFRMYSARILISPSPTLLDGGMWAVPQVPVPPLRILPIR